MTFSIVVPNAGQSPGLFPAQNNTNFSRIKDNINNDHNWLDTAAAAQGIHKQVTTINRATPVGLTAGNGILYSKLDAYNNSQLYWYNGGSDKQITNGGQIQIGSGNVNLNAGTSGVSVFTVPDDSFGYIYIFKTATSAVTNFALWRSVGGVVFMQSLANNSIQYATSANLEILAFVLNLAPLIGNYQYRVFQVA